jgi:CTP:molybdopterin cytidylyltransferase MocA
MNMKTFPENQKGNASAQCAARWGVVLAGGNGTRLRELVYRRRADYLPKQCVNFTGTRSMLEPTLDRVQKLIAPKQLLIVITKEQLSFENVRHQPATAGEFSHVGGTRTPRERTRRRAGPP